MTVSYCEYEMSMDEWVWDEWVWDEWVWDECVWNNKYEYDKCGYDKSNHVMTWVILTRRLWHEWLRGTMTSVSVTMNDKK